MANVLPQILKEDQAPTLDIPGGIITPVKWLTDKYPSLADKYGAPLSIKISGDRPSIQALNEDFFSAVLGAEGAPAWPVIFLPDEGRFYAYSPSEGIYIPFSEHDMEAELSDILLECCRACPEGIDKTNLEFKLRKSASLSGPVRRSKARLKVCPGHFAQHSVDYLACKNGILRFADFTLLEFAPAYPLRNKLAVEFQAGAHCSRLQDELLALALAPDDIDLLQR